MLEFLKNYYILALVLLMLSYLLPREGYQVYVQFFIGVFVVVLLLQLVMKHLSAAPVGELTELYEAFENNRETWDWQQQKGGDVFEYFSMEGEGE